MTAYIRNALFPQMRLQPDDRDAFFRELQKVNGERGFIATLAASVLMGVFLIFYLIEGHYSSAADSFRTGNAVFHVAIIIWMAVNSVLIRRWLRDVVKNARKLHASACLCCLFVLLWTLVFLRYTSHSVAAPRFEIYITMLFLFSFLIYPQPGARFAVYFGSYLIYLLLFRRIIFATQELSAVLRSLQSVTVCIVLSVVTGALNYNGQVKSFLYRKQRDLDVAELKRLYEVIELQSITDALTGIYNRRRFDALLAEEWARAARTNQPIALIIIDVDFFKQYNDIHGHAAGDACLKAVAEVMGSAAKRRYESLFRIGGEEFAIVVPNAAAKDVAHLCADVLERTEAKQIPHGGSSVSQYVTVSAGAALMYPSADNTQDVIFELADRRLYEAKNGGRNRFCFAE